LNKLLCTCENNAHGNHNATVYAKVRGKQKLRQGIPPCALTFVELPSFYHQVLPLSH